MTFVCRRCDAIPQPFQNCADHEPVDRKGDEVGGQRNGARAGTVRKEMIEQFFQSCVESRDIPRVAGRRPLDRSIKARWKDSGQLANQRCVLRAGHKVSGVDSVRLAIVSSNGKRHKCFPAIPRNG